MEIDGEVFSLFSSSISFRGVSSKLNFQTESKYGAIFGHKALCICQSGAILFNNGTLAHLLRQRLGDRRTDLDLIYVPPNSKRHKTRGTKIQIRAERLRCAFVSQKKLQRRGEGDPMKYRRSYSL